MTATTGLPSRVLAGAGFAGGEAAAAGIDRLVAISRTQPHRASDFRPPPPLSKRTRTLRDPWRIAMKARTQTDDARAHHRKRTQAVEPVFGIIKSAMGLRRSSLRSLLDTATGWTLVALACDCRRMTALMATP